MSQSLISQGDRLTAAQLPIQSSLPRGPEVSTGDPTRKRVLWPTIIAGIVGVVVAGSRLSQSLPALQSVRLDFELVSPKPFLQEIPRTALLGVLHANGTRETLIGRTYGSAFLQQLSTIRFDVADPNATRFFFSPGRPGELMAITEVAAFESGGGKKIDIPLARLSPVQQVEVLTQAEDRLVCRTQPGNGLPLLTFELPKRRPVGVGGYVVAGLDALAFLAGAFLGTLAALLAIRRYWPLTLPSSANVIRGLPLVAAAALICVIALWSRFNAHPDEYLHFESARYFASHWLPPALDDPAAEPSFGHYGVSYLQNLDAAYFLMGKFMALIPPSVTSRETAGRLFNCLLFMGLSLWLVVRLGSSFAPAVLILTPQIWYIFAYVNGDAWALAVSLVTIGLLADETSVVSRFLCREQPGPITGGIVFGACLTLILLAKHNYYPLFAFVVLGTSWRCFVWSPPVPVRLFARRAALVAAVVAGLYLPLSLIQNTANRFQLARIQIEQAEKFAAPMFKPSAIAAGRGAPLIGVRNHGTSFLDVLNSDWTTRTFQSFCGVYHWMSLPSPQLYYYGMGAGYLALLGVLAVAMRRAPGSDRLFCLLTLSLALGQVLLSAYHSWVADFQPQGRYLFPILPLLAFVLHRYRQWLPAGVLNMLFGSMFALSTFSFVFTALRYFAT